MCRDRRLADEPRSRRRPRATTSHGQKTHKPKKPKTASTGSSHSTTATPATATPAMATAARATTSRRQHVPEPRAPHRGALVVFGAIRSAGDPRTDRGAFGRGVRPLRAHDQPAVHAGAEDDRLRSRLVTRGGPVPLRLRRQAVPGSARRLRDVQRRAEQPAGSRGADRVARARHPRLGPARRVPPARIARGGAARAHAGETRARALHELRERRRSRQRSSSAAPRRGVHV